MSNEPRVNIRNAAIELAEYLKSNPSDIEKSELSIGANYLAIYLSDQFNLNSDKAKELIKEAILLAIEDLSTGGVALRGGLIGVQFYENKLELFVTSHELAPLGTIVFRIGIKHIIAFQGWRTKEGEELPQLQTNCSVYFLIVSLGKYL